MPVFNTINKLRNPFPSILPYLIELNRQLAFDFNGTDTDNTEFGTLTAVRKNFKPFIIGFIPPDVPINFLPFDKVVSTISGISVIQINNANKNGFRNVVIPDNIPSYSPSPAGEVPRTKTVIQGSDLRVSLAKSFKTVLGFTPTEDQVALVYAQIGSELRKDGNTFTASNFNLGNIHTGTPGRYDDGPNGPWIGQKKDGQPAEPGHTGPPPDLKKSVAPNSGLSGSGRHFIGSDADSHDRWYPTPFVAFNNLQEASDYQIAFLARRYPNALKATDAKSYNSGLLDFGSKYHETPRDRYEQNISNGVSNYKKTYGNNPLGGGLTISGDPTESNEPPVPKNQEQIQRNIMSTGVFTGTEDDPIGDRIGRGVVSTTDQDKIAVVKEQTDNLRRQIQRIQDTPPLLLLINPTDFTRQYQATVDSSPKGRYGHIVHQWIERPGTISSSGVTAAQYVFTAEGAGGLTAENRVYSLGYQNLLSLIGIYKNNGIIFANDGSSGAHTGVPISAFSVYIYYDNNIYIGSFDNMSVRDDANKPHNMSYDFTFTVRYEESLDGLDFFDTSVVNNTAGSGQTIIG